MKKAIRILRQLFELNIKTIYFNFKYLPFNQAIKLPFLISNKVVLKSMQGSVVIDGPIRRKMIKIGFRNVGIFDYKYSRSIWQVSGQVIFKGNSVIGQGSKISISKQGKLLIGKGLIISAETSIVASQTTIEIGSNCLMSWDILIMDTDFHKVVDMAGNQINTPKQVVIGDNVWIGCRSLILKGSIIPKNAVIAAGTTITKKLEGENCIFGGQPARIVKREVGWKI